MKKLTFALLVVLTSACTNPEQTAEKLTREQAIQQIYEVEQAFNEMFAAEGRAAAFAHFAAPDGGIQRSGKMIVGKDSIRAFYDRSTSTNLKLTWKPDRVDISDDFTMASTWGKYQYSGTRANGEDFETTGIFHTVWKRQPDGSWRYIYD